MLIIQIGANDGKDHVFDFIKKNSIPISKLILIEANPKCIPLLQETYKDYPFVEIHNFAVVTGDEETVDLLIPENDGTSGHASISNDHMTNHGHSRLSTVTVPAKNINQIFGEFTNGTVDRFYIDVEGFDVPIINQIDFSAMNIPYICFEYIHSDGSRSYGGPQLDACKAKLEALGYSLSTVEYNIIAQK